MVVAATDGHRRGDRNTDTTLAGRQCTHADLHDQGYEGENMRERLKHGRLWKCSLPPTGSSSHPSKLTAAARSGLWVRFSNMPIQLLDRLPGPCGHDG